MLTSNSTCKAVAQLSQRILCTVNQLTHRLAHLMWSAWVTKAGTARCNTAQKSIRAPHLRHEAAALRGRQVPQHGGQLVLDAVVDRLAEHLQRAGRLGSRGGAE